MQFSARCNKIALTCQLQRLRFIFGGKTNSTKDYLGRACRKLSVAGPSESASSRGEASKHVWSKEWDRLSFGAVPPWNHTDHIMEKVLFVESGFGCDQHGDRKGQGATKAAVRACRNAIEFNSIPCIAELVPGGRPNMKIKIKLGVPAEVLELCQVDLGAVCAVFPYGKILPIEVVPGGLSFQSGRVVEALGDKEDISIIVVAAITVGY